MRLIKPSCEVIPQENTLEGVYKMIELAGRTCYKSEDKITETSAKEFVDRMIKSGHGAMLEHGTIYLHYQNLKEPLEDMKYCPYTKINKVQHLRKDLGEGVWEWNYYVTTNYRALLNNAWEDELIYLCKPTEYHEKRVTVKFICDRGVSHEFVRHRVFSFAQESTRYCNYSKDKFGNEITCITPSWMTNLDDYLKAYTGSRPAEDEITAMIYYQYIYSLNVAEEQYFILLNLGQTAQQARAVLPNSLKTELVMTGFISDWQHFFELRTATSAHPDARALAIPLQEEFKQLKLI